MKNRIVKILGYSPTTLFSLSSIGFIQKHRNFTNLSRILEKFSQVLPDNLRGTPGITEVDQEAPIHRISQAMDGVSSLGYHQDAEKYPLIENTHPNYTSDILVNRDLPGAYKLHFTQGIRHLLRLSKMTPPQRSTPHVSLI